jgi:hypothetical protein
VLSGFRRGVNEICDVLGFYAALNGNFAPTFRGNPSSKGQALSSSGGEEASWLRGKAERKQLQPFSLQQKSEGVSENLNTRKTFICHKRVYV